MTVGQSREAFASGPLDDRRTPERRRKSACVSRHTGRSPPPPEKNADMGVKKGSRGLAGCVLDFFCVGRLVLKAVLEIGLRVAEFPWIIFQEDLLAIALKGVDVSVVLDLSSPVLLPSLVLSLSVYSMLYLHQRFSCWGIL